MTLTVEQARKEAEAARERGVELAHDLIKQFNLNLPESQKMYFIHDIGTAFVNEYAGFWRKI
jgi:hypothetical protein